MEDAKSSCPKCGYCSHCGRGGYWTMPFVPYGPYYPVYPHNPNVPLSLTTDTWNYPSWSGGTGTDGGPDVSFTTTTVTSNDLMLSETS